MDDMQIYLYFTKLSFDSEPIEHTSNVMVFQNFVRIFSSILLDNGKIKSCDRAWNSTVLLHFMNTDQMSSHIQGFGLQWFDFALLQFKTLFTNKANCRTILDLEVLPRRQI